VKSYRFVNLLLQKVGSQAGWNMWP
jgi:hypothetical protein